ncbi:MAG TPA: hypothetical protein VK194_09335, partial [Candidatus Deferrimicrobium sp.]|nr:hypothetical protein [Candidatus Deferrimicrobium sp.]
AAMAILAFVVVMVTLGTALFAFGGGGGGTKALSSVAAGEAALRTINANLDEVFGPGVDLVNGDPQKAYELLSAAWDGLEAAKAANVPATTLEPLRAKTVAGLDRLFHVVPVAAATILATASSKTPLDIGAMILGPQGVPFVLDKATASVYRIDLRTKKATVVFRSKTRAAGTVEGVPRLLTTAARDLVIVDNKNVVWRWRPKDTSGNGTTTLIKVAGSAGWGDDVVAVGTFLRSASEGLYNLYVVDPSEQNILAYSAARDGSGFPSNPQQRLAVARDVSKVTALLIDGDIFVADGGTIVRFVGGKSEGWSIQAPGTATFAPDGDVLLRPAPRYTLIASASDKRAGLLYAWDQVSGRVVAFDKAKGTFVEQYRLIGGSPALGDVRGMYVVLGAAQGAPTTLFWATKDAVMSAVLEAVSDQPATGPGASGSPGPSAGSSSPPKASPKGSAKASRAP